MDVSDVQKQRKALLGNTVKKSYHIESSEKINQRLPYDASRKSYAYWYDENELNRILLGTRHYQDLSHYK